MSLSISLSSSRTAFRPTLDEIEEALKGNKCKLIEQQKVWTVQLNNYQEISKETAVFLIRAVLKLSVFFLDKP